MIHRFLFPPLYTLEQVCVVNLDDIVNTKSTPFWETKSLADMSVSEWESLCDGCGRCCLNKLEDWDTGEIHFTNIACTLFDGETCRCKDYDNRFDTVPDCIKLAPQDIDAYHWLPSTCAYRRLDEGKKLPIWHPLITGTTESVHLAGISVRGRTITEDGLSVEDYEDHLVDWVNEEK
jgi:uncharacterized cysteine cluster protein YcgN (CxxCxxCC family)